MAIHCNETTETSKTGKVGRWQVGWAHKEHETELLKLFQTSFDQTMPVEQWRWKYRNSEPLGSYVKEQGRLVAFYGGMPRRIRLLGEKGTAVQIGDVMVAPRQRRVFTRHGALFLAASTFTEGLVGPDKPYLCGFGFPSERHNRLGEHLGLYGRIGELLEAEWQPLASRQGLTSTVQPLESAQLDLLQQLWQDMADDLHEKVVLERDKSYIQSRFLQHPTVDYMSLLVRQRFTRKPLGLLILRDRGAEGVELIDMVGALRSFPLLVTTAQRITGKLRRPRLFAWLTDLVADALQETNPQLKDLNLPLPVLRWKQTRDLLDTRDQWWLIGGDTDFR